MTNRISIPESIKGKLSNLPDDPGVYIMKNAAGKVIYVGKARVLKNRVRSYFHTARKPDAKTTALISKITDFEVLVTDNEIEALILEANLIKEYRPRYNVNLKDDKRYPYIRITLHEPFPRVLITRRLEKDGSKYFGPYTEAKKMRAAVDFLNDIFPLRTCTQIPAEGSIRKPCLNYQIGKCIGTCIGKASQEDYRLIINNVITFLNGRKQELVNQLVEQMGAYSSEQNYEAAARCRDQIRAIERIIQKQKVVNADRLDRDYIGSAEVAEDGCFSVLQIRDGVLLGRQHFYYKSGSGDHREFIKNFIINYYKEGAAFPREILVSGEVADKMLLERWLSKKASHKVAIVLPQKGRKAGLLNLAISNASLLLDELLVHKEGSQSKLPHSLYELQSVLRLDKIPRGICAFDISNLGESEAVGSMVFFRDGYPRKGNYRHFRIKLVEGQDDFAMMAEVVGRYFRRVGQKKEDTPDLVLIDGGKGQLNAAEMTLRSLNYDIPVISLAKRLDEVFVPNKKESILIPHSSSALKLLQRLRDEAHRFAIEYHRKLRAKRAIASELDEVPGIGEVRKLHLLAKFGTVQAIKVAPFSELLTCPGIPKKLASVIYDYFHPKV